MKKQILSVAVAAAFAAPVAMAEISLSGSMDFDITKADTAESMPPDAPMTTRSIPICATKRSAP